MKFPVKNLMVECDMDGVQSLCIQQLLYHGIRVSLQHCIPEMLHSPCPCVEQAAQVKFPIENLMAEGDTDGDGRISFAEFKKMLRTTSINSRSNAFSGEFSLPTHSGRSGGIQKAAGTQ